MDVRKVVDNAGKLMDQVNQLTLSQVLVGVPEDRASRNDGVVTNAMIARISEFGSPAQNIPARPFLRPGIRAAQKDIVAIMKQGAQDALLGQGSVDVTLGQVGMAARNAAIRAITDPAPPFAPLQPATIRARMRKTAGGRRKLRQFKAKGGFAAWAYAVDPVTGNPINVKPLIDTGALRRSISYVVRKAE